MYNFRYSLLAAIILPAAFSVQAAEGDKVSVITDPSVMVVPVKPTNTPTLGCCKCLGESNILDLSTTPNSKWTVSNDPNPAVLGSPVTDIAAANITPGWAIPPTGINWISAPSNVPAAGGKHYYKFRFRVLDCTIGQTVNVNIKSLRADNAATVTLYKSPNATPPSWSAFPAAPVSALSPAGHLGECGQYHVGETRPEHCFTTPAAGVPSAAFYPDAVHLAAPLTPAFYTMVVEVLDTSAVATGLLIQASLTGQCQKNLIRDAKEMAYPVDNYDNGKLTIHAVDVNDAFGGKIKYKATMSLQPLSNPLTFILDQAEQLPLLDPVDESTLDQGATDGSGYIDNGQYVEGSGIPVNKTSCSTGWVSVKGSNPARWTCGGTVTGTGPLDFS